MTQRKIDEIRIGDRRFNSRQAATAGLTEFDPNRPADERGEPSNADLEDVAKKEPQSPWARFTRSKQPPVAAFNQDMEQQQSRESDRESLISRLIQTTDGLGNQQIEQILKAATEIRMTSKYPGGTLSNH